MDVGLLVYALGFALVGNVEVYIRERWLQGVADNFEIGLCECLLLSIVAELEMYLDWIYF